MSPRTVLVTGASSGIGRATAVAASRRGDHLVLAARGVPALAGTEYECASAGAASVRVVPTDVGDDAAVEALVTTALEVTGRLDAVVNAAGVVGYGRLEEVPAEVFDGVLRTDVTGAANLARHVVPVLRRQDSGTLLLVGSVVGHIGVPLMTSYVVSKWAVRALARQLQLENRDRPGLHVVHLAPGSVDTPIYQVAANHTGAEGRPPPPVTTPEHVAQRILHLLDEPRKRSQVGLGNNVMRFGFSALPGVYDALVGPLAKLAIRDLGRPVAATAGNVLATLADRYAVRGESRSLLGALRANLRR